MTSDKSKILEEFQHHLQSCIDSNSSWKLTLSKSISDKSLIKAVFHPVLAKDKLIIKLVESYKTKDLTYSLNIEEFHTKKDEMITSAFYFADLTTEKRQTSLKQNKKGQVTILKRDIHHPGMQTPQAHNRNKNRMIPEDAKFLQVLGLSSSHGKIFAPAQKKYRQINKFIEILDTQLKDLKEDKCIYIADMGCGKAYLSFAIQYWLSERKIPHRITGYDIRPELIEENNENAKKLEIDSLIFKQGDINEVEIDQADMVIALHACDIATDMAIAKGIQSGAKYLILSPCCHKQIRQEIKSKNVITKFGILKERQAEIVTDVIRALILEHSGYKTNIFEFISYEHTGKNLMITAVKTKANPTALNEVDQLKKEYGISYHYLERLLGLM
jgi:SAM-dependent methyltransferase